MWQTMRPIAMLATVGMLVLAGCGDGDDPSGLDLPGAPSNIGLSVDTTSITVSWTAGSGADSHEVVLTAPGEDDREETVAGSDTTVTFESLTPGVTYTATVSAVNGAGRVSGPARSITVESDVEFVSNDILEDVTWTRDKTYVLQGVVLVGKDVGADASRGISVTLTIEPGTTIVGASSVSARGSYLVISRGSMIIADANRSLPARERSSRPDPDSVIVFTSEPPRGRRNAGDWGGLVINGRAPINSGAEAEGQADSGLYGGPDEMDNSGILRGVRVEFAGDEVNATDQLNGIAFQGVGAGTTVDYVQVHHSGDDGMAMLGGAVSQTHVVLTGAGDHSFSGTGGSKGFLQFGIIRQVGDDADNGFGLSNDGVDEDATPRSTAVIANVTAVGASDAIVDGDIAGAESAVGVLFREGAAFRLCNNIVTGFGASGFDIEGSRSAALADARLGGVADPEASLSFANNILWSNGAVGGGDENFADASDDGYDQAENKAFFEAFDNVLADPDLRASAFNEGSMESPPDFIPAGMPDAYSAFDVSTLNNGAGLIMPADGRALVQTDYAGAVEPGTVLEDVWYFGWTVWSHDGSDSRPNHEHQDDEDDEEGN